MAQARRASVQLTYNSKSADQMAPYIESFKYTDIASGSSDSISIQLRDRDRVWINGWFPKKGDKLKPIIVYSDWEQDGKAAAVACGTFVVDDFSFSGGPISCRLDAVAIPATSGFKATERTQTYEKTNLKEIGQKIASRNGLTLYFEPADTVSIETVAQDKQTDCTFYNDLITKYGLALKVYNDRLVVFDEATYEAKTVVETLTEEDFESNWKYNTTLAGTYTGMKYSYTHTEKNKTFTVEVGGGDRILTCDDAANNLTEATRIAVAKLNNANKGTTTMQITLKGSHKIVATSCVQIKGMGNLDGKYYVEKADTSIGSGTKTTLSLRKVEKRFVKAPPPEEQTPVRPASSSSEAAKQQKKADESAKKKAMLEAKFGTGRTKTVAAGSASVSGQSKAQAAQIDKFGPSRKVTYGTGSATVSGKKVQKASTSHFSSSGASHGGTGGKIPVATKVTTTNTKSSGASAVSTVAKAAITKTVNLLK